MATEGHRAVPAPVRWQSRGWLVDKPSARTKMCKKCGRGRARDGDLVSHRTNGISERPPNHKPHTKGRQMLPCDTLSGCRMLSCWQKS
jgi:hypothetical protein